MPTRLIPLAALALLCASCGFKHEPTGVLAAYPQSVRDAIGHEVQIDAAPRHIVSLDPGMTAAMYALGAEKLLVGRSGSETYPKQAMHLPVMVKNGKPNIKAIEKAQPDVVLVPASMAPTVGAADQLARKLASEVYVVGGSSAGRVENDITELGLITDRAAEGRRVAGEMQSAVKRIHAAVAGEPPVPVFVDQGFGYTIDPTGLTGDLLRLAGGRNVAANADPSQRISGTELATLAPAVYISAGDAGATLADLKRHKATAQLPAVLDKRVVQLPVSVLTEDGPRLPQALARIAKLLHPDASIPA
ncbi:MAG TPA: ABC transporter substrate-binding protein [Gaiellales bacterium]|nr:ABC transporter substrate-binding protein [Gaiellales bacterium]